MARDPASHFKERSIAMKLSLLLFALFTVGLVRAGPAMFTSCAMAVIGETAMEACAVTMAGGGAPWVACVVLAGGAKVWWICLPMLAAPGP